MDVIAGGHGMAERSDHLTVFSDAVTRRQITERDLVAERQRFAKAERDGLSALAHRYDCILSQGFQKHGDIIIVVQHDCLLGER
jgi:hypothetical protein